MDRDWLVIGRGRSADVVLRRAHDLPRSHAAIALRRERGSSFRTSGSTNGTLVNGGRRQIDSVAQELRMSSRWEWLVIGDRRCQPEPRRTGRDREDSGGQRGHSGQRRDFGIQAKVLASHEGDGEESRRESL